MTLNAALQRITEQLVRVTEVPQAFERETGRAAFLKRIQRDPELRRLVDQACQHFAESGALPRADQEIGFYVLDRFAEASHCGRIMGDFAHADGPWLSWLLLTTGS